MAYILYFIIPLIPILCACLYSHKKDLKSKLCHKVVLITGASSGLGEALSLKFYKAGCKLILCSRNLNQLNNVKNSLLQLNINNDHVPEVVQLDLSKHDTIKIIAKNILENQGRVDILINNAGVGYRGSCVDTELDVHKEIMNINYFGQVELTQAFLPHWIKNRYGHIVFIGSLQSKLSLPYRSAYGASKHALQAYADCLRAEVAIHNIHVTSILPAYIKTELSLNAFTANGSVYNKMDETQRNGISPSTAADHIVMDVATVSKEILLSSLVYKIAVYARNILPDFYFYLMSRRAVKLSVK